MREFLPELSAENERGGSQEMLEEEGHDGPPGGGPEPTVRETRSSEEEERETGLPADIDIMDLPVYRDIVVKELSRKSAVPRQVLEASHDGVTRQELYDKFTCSSHEVDHALSYLERSGVLEEEDGVYSPGRLSPRYERLI